MSERTLTVVVVEPMKKPELREIPNALRAMQEIVGGYIEAVFPFPEPVALICNEEGKLRKMQPNRVLKDPAGNIRDVIVGTFFIAGLGDEAFVSLDDKQVERYTEMFRRPQVFGRAVSV